MKARWRGRFYEDFEVGDVYRHPPGGTVMVGKLGQAPIIPQPALK